MFIINIIVSIRCAVVIFHLYKPIRSTNMFSLNWPLPWLARKKYNKCIVQNDFKTNLYMHNTKGNVVLMNNLAKIKIILKSMVLCNIQNNSSSPILNLGMSVLGMFLSFGHFLASCSYKKSSYKNRVYVRRGGSDLRKLLNLFMITQDYQVYTI